MRRCAVSPAVASALMTDDAVLSDRPSQGLAIRNAKSPLPNRFSSYEDGEDKWRIHAAGNHFILSRSQCLITAEMVPDGLAVDDRSKRAAEAAHIIISVSRFSIMK
jgi:hypothetical protein